MSMHWTANGGTNDSRLKPWLDPLNKGFDSYHGDDYSTYQSGISDLQGKELQINIYPNPAKDKITIELPKENGTLTFNIFNELGQLVREGFMNDKTELLLNGLSNGSYTLKIFAKDQTYSSKIVIAGNN
jgi:hypothetical protein